MAKVPALSQGNVVAFSHALSVLAFNCNLCSGRGATMFLTRQTTSIRTCILPGTTEQSGNVSVV